jgi:hypothetical protein
MSKAVVLRAVNTILFLSFITQVVTAILIALHVNTPYTQLIFEIHEHNGFLMIAFVAIHITLNWGWVKANFFKKHGE